MSRVILIGIGPDGPSQAGRAALINVRWVVTAARHAHYLTGLCCEMLPISPLNDALSRIEERLNHGDVAVLASGDPLFFGMGRSLGARFGAERLAVHPAVSSMQLAFAHWREPWQDAIFLSLHGRGLKDGVALTVCPSTVCPSTPLREQRLGQSFPERSRRAQNFDRSFPEPPFGKKLRRRTSHTTQDLIRSLTSGRPVFLFTDSNQRPELIAAEVNRHLQDLGLNDSDCRIMVAEDLGSDSERISHGTPESIAAQRFSDLNVMIIHLTPPASHDSEFAFGLKETEIAHSRGLITKDEVRAAILHRLRLPRSGVLWDIGAGSGSIAIEAARLSPGLTVFAIERHSAEQQNILANRKTFRLTNLHLVPGQAPEALAGLPNPDRVFIGGSGGQLPAIVETIRPRLANHGIIIASAVTAATREAAPRIFHQHGLQVEITTIAIRRESYPPQAGGPLSLNPITIITGST